MKRGIDSVYGSSAMSLSIKYFVFTLLVVPLYGGCKQPVQPTGTPPAPEVVTINASTRRVIDYREYTGRTAAVDSVDIRARVSGYLLQSPRTSRESGPDRDSGVEIFANEGQLVKKGDILFVVDPRPYELALKQSQGLLDAAQARLIQATQALSRSESLIERNATSRAEYDQATGAVAELRGQIENLKAVSARNQLDLEFTRVGSPIEGLLGQTLVTVGNLVVADTTILANVISVDPILVDFEVDEQSVLDYRTRIAGGEVKSARDTTISIRLGLANEKGFPHQGTINFVNNQTDPGTGNTRIRGTFRNESGILSPGLFARIQVPFTAEYEAVLVPTKALAMDQQGRHVFVIGKGNRAARRAVKLGQNIDDMSVIREGVNEGEQIVTSGLQKIRQGAEVRLVAGDRL